MLKKIKIVHILVLVAIVSALALYACGRNQTTGQQGIQALEVAVITLVAQPVTHTSELPGRTASFLRAEVRPQVTGIITSRLFTEGSEVQKGDVLYEIEPDTYQAVFNNAQAALAKAKANLEVIEIKARRIEGLRRNNAVSVQDNDETKAALAQAKAEVSSTQAMLETAHINLERTKITAPVSGSIGKSSVTAGVLVSGNQPEPLATIYQLDPMYVDVTRSANEIQQLRRALAQREDQGDTPATQTNVELIFDDGTPYPHKGMLRFTDVSVNEATGAVTLRAEFPNPKHELLPGLYVRAILHEGAEEAILIPQKAVIRDNKGNPMVFVVDAESKANLRPIKTGKEIGSSWHIISGLSAGEKIVVEGFQRLRPGMPVIAVEPEPAKNAETAEKAAAKAE
jgi:membrane fusion protein (multidrug efflux system)